MVDELQQEEIELEQADRCIQCGADLIAMDLPEFALDAERRLCSHCAAQRGGKFDPIEQSWDPAPNVDDLV